MGFLIKCERRNDFGKNAARRLRREQMIPAVLYGKKEENVPLSINKKDIFNILKSETAENTIFKLDFDAGKKDVMFRELQKDPVTDEILHADLIQIAMDKPIQISVPVLTVGEAVGVKAEGGFLDFITREVELECLPKDIPDHIQIDISSLHIGQSLKVEDLDLPQVVSLISEPNVILVNVEAPHKEEEVVVEEEEEIIGEEEEPEVIKKEKEEAAEKEKSVEE
ncbi:MAG: 50S ribosomal protein L25/general stress protein Ctc [Candidatus Aminicenantes bacterium]|nr:50S ribosomal protein L25/general stress protein Ctc [Candidatus Aminicenantes bacterium]